VIYSKVPKRLGTPNRLADILEAKRVQVTMDGIPQGEPEPRLLVSVTNFIRLMNPTFSIDNIEPMTVWVPEAFLPSGIIEELNLQDSMDDSDDSEVGLVDLPT